MEQLNNKLVLNYDDEENENNSSKLVDEAFQAYEQSVARGDKEIITQIKYYIYCMRFKMAQIHDYVSATKEMLQSIDDIAQEVDGLFEMSFDEASDRFAIGLERYPRFMREFVRRRRAKRYYRDKIREIESKIKITMDRVGFASSLTRTMVDSMGAMTRGFAKAFNFSTGKRKKKNDFMVTQDLEADFARRKAASAVFSGTAQPTQQSGGSSSSGTTGGTTGGSVPPAGGSDGAPGDHWDDDVM